MPVTDDYLAFLDTETGGLTPGKSCVIEVATILTDHQLVEVGRYEAKIKLRPGDVVGTEAAKINGYDPAVWEEEGVPFSDYQEWLERKIPRGSVAIPVGHNVGFDRDMIDLGYYKPYGKFCQLSYNKVATVGIAMALKVAGVIDVPNVKLSTVSAALGIEHSRAHSAMADLLVAKAIFERTASFFRRAAKVAASAAPILLLTLRCVWGGM